MMTQAKVMKSKSMYHLPGVMLLLGFPVFPAGHLFPSELNQKLYVEEKHCEQVVLAMSFHLPKRHSLETGCGCLCMLKA